MYNFQGEADNGKEPFDAVCIFRMELGYLHDALHLQLCSWLLL